MKYDKRQKTFEKTTYPQHEYILCSKMEWFTFKINFTHVQSILFSGKLFHLQNTTAALSILTFIYGEGTACSHLLFKH